MKGVNLDAVVQLMIHGGATGVASQSSYTTVQNAGQRSDWKYCWTAGFVVRLLHVVYKSWTQKESNKATPTSKRPTWTHTPIVTRD